MEKEGNRSPAKAPDPFGGLIRARLKRMRLVDEKGRPDMAVLGVFADIYAGIFYDDLRRLLGSAEDLLTVYETFLALRRFRCMCRTVQN